MTEPCQGPDPHPRKPRFQVPAGAIDSHFHLFGPAARYAMVAEREYTPPVMTAQQAHHLFDTLGIARAVVIQPSIYGDDNRAQLEGAADIGIPVRAVVVVPADVPDRQMAKLSEQGARAIRFILAHPGGLPVAGLERAAARAKEMGWHIQILAKGAQLVELEPRLAKLACPLAIDHIGMIRPADGVEQPAFQALLRLMRQGHWVKLSGAYRLSQEPPPYRDLIPYVRELVAAREDRLIWGSDWPHVFVKGAMPNTTDLMDLLVDWIPEQAIRQLVLVDDPAKLYSF